MKATVLPSSFILPSHVITSKYDYQRHMRDTKWRFVVFKNADVDAHNALLNSKDKEPAPYAQVLPASDKLEDVIFRAINLKNKLQF